MYSFQVPSGSYLHEETRYWRQKHVLTVVRTWTWREHYDEGDAGMNARVRIILLWRFALHIIFNKERNRRKCEKKGIF